MSYPTLAQAIADPIVQTGTLAVVGAISIQFGLRNHPAKRFIVQLCFLAALTSVLLYQGIVPFEGGQSQAPLLHRVFIIFAKIVWWTNAAWAVAGFVRIFLIFEERPREGRLIQDLLVGLIYLGAVLSVVAYVFDMPVGTLIATSGVFAIILGLALQSTLSDVFSGIALNLGRPYSIGDWIRLSDGIEGRVVETNWRATHLLNGTNDLVILPNSDLAKVRLTNLSSPDRSHGTKLDVRMMPMATPESISDVMRNVLLSCNSILRFPEPTVQVTSLDAQAVVVELMFRVADFSTVAAARSEVFDLIYRHTKAAGLRLAPPPGTPMMSATQLQSDLAAVQQRATPLRLLDSLTLFASLTEDEKAALAKSMRRRVYRKDDVLIEQGATLSSLMVIRTGVVAVTCREGEREIVSKLAPGDCFGEGGLLTGAAETGTIRALTFVVVYEIGQADLAKLMNDRPSMAEELGSILARRAESEKERAGHSTQIADARSVSRLVARIRHLFDVPHG
jgi:small-conductance mechanosensitive channel/CRP-like cAMP-binding protein